MQFVASGRRSTHHPFNSARTTSASSAAHIRNIKTMQPGRDIAGPYCGSLGYRSMGTGQDSGELKVRMMADRSCPGSLLISYLCSVAVRASPLAPHGFPEGAVKLNSRVILPRRSHHPNPAPGIETEPARL